MEKIIIAVGSTRRPKLNAVNEAINVVGSMLATDSEFEIVGVEVPSGVGHTPCSREELMRGARQRAEALVQVARQRNESWRYFLGLEGGLDIAREDVLYTDGGTEASEVRITTSGDNTFKNLRRVFLESWAYVTDGARGYFGRSGGVEIPEALAHEVVDNGTELSEAIDRFAVSQDPDQFAGTSGIRNAQGAWGVLSCDLITRQEAFRVAVIAAFAPFYNAKMYRSAPLRAKV
jgi:non-canonical (house-cleaning) NTP pyrophosphatase